MSSRMGVESYQSRWALGRCVGLAQEESDRIFFPSAGRPKKNPEYDEYCSTCPIKNFCLSYAIVHDEDGVWGGLTRSQRDHLLKNSPNVKEALIEEAQLQGWYETRLSIEDILREVQERQSPAVNLEFADLGEAQEDLSIFEFVLEYTVQIEPVLSEPQGQLPKVVLPVDSGNGQCEDSSVSLFGFPSVSLDTH